MFKSWKAKLRGHIDEIIKTKMSPHSIALGFSLGTFISIIPTPGINLLLGLLVVALFPKISKYAVLVGILFWNPLISAPLYPLAYEVGDRFFGAMSIEQYQLVFLNTIYNFTRRFLVGVIIIAASVAVLSYPVVWGISSWYQRGQ